MTVVKGCHEAANLKGVPYVPTLEFWKCNISEIDLIKNEPNLHAVSPFLQCRMRKICNMRYLDQGFLITAKTKAHCHIQP